MRDASPLVRKAIELQTSYGWTDERFSKEVLGISPAYWSYLRRGERTGRGGAFVAQVLRRFPDWALLLRDDLPIENADRKVVA